MRVSSMAKLKHIALNLKTFLVLAAAYGASVAAPLSSAHAQYYGRPILSEHRVLQGLQARGFRRLSPPVLNNDVFVLDAIDPRGQPVRLIVSAFSGQIVDAHPQRQTRWTRAEPPQRWDEDDEEYDPRTRRHDRWRGDRWRDRQARMPDEEWPQDRWNGPQVDRDDPGLQTFPPEANPQISPGNPTQRRAPERVTTSPLPPPATQQRDPDLPQPTLKNPTIVKRSPTAIPKDPNEKPQIAPKAPSVTTAPQPKPGMGTRDNPRVIELAPKPATAPHASTPESAPKAAEAPAARATPPTTSLPPPNVLDGVTPPPAVSTPPATLE